MRTCFERCLRTRCLTGKEDAKTLTQLFSGQEFTLDIRYAVIMNVVFVSLFYSGGIPILYFSACLSFFFAYWFDKTAFFGN